MRHFLQAMATVALALSVSACASGSHSHTISPKTAMSAMSSANSGTLSHVQATVLEVEGNGRIYAHHSAFHGMPAMTMEFTVLPISLTLKPGDFIDADVDVSHDPWMMTNIKRHRPMLVHMVAQVPLLAVGDHLPELPLIDQNGLQRRWTDFAGHPFALSFIYTRCQDPKMCPATTAKFLQATHVLVGSKARLVELTLDPNYDTPRILRAYQNQYGLDGKMLTLLVSQLRPTKIFAARLGVLERPVPGGLLHTERVVIVDGHGRITQFFNDTNWRAGDVEAALKAAR
jgi:protein SCO1/2